MGAHLSGEQIERLVWLRSRIRFPRIVLFLDRDQAGRNGVRQIREQLQDHHFEVTVFDWDQFMSWNGRNLEPIPDAVQDPADMSVEQLQHLRREGII